MYSAGAERALGIPPPIVQSAQAAQQRLQGVHDARSAT